MQNIFKLSSGKYQFTGLPTLQATRMKLVVVTTLEFQYLLHSKSSFPLQMFLLISQPLISFLILNCYIVVIKDWKEKIQ